MNPRITLITVCYNIETTIAKVLQSARAFKQVQSGAVLIVYCARWAGRERCISLKSQRVVQGGRLGMCMRKRRHVQGVGASGAFCR